MRLTDDGSEEIKDIHSSRKQNLGIEDNEQSRFRFLAECREIHGLNDIINKIRRGHITIPGGFNGGRGHIIKNASCWHGR